LLPDYGLRHWIGFAMDFEIIDRPEINRNKIKNDLNYDNELEAALLGTLDTGRAIKVTLSMFHCSPAKGRLWLKGHRVRHRVLPDREHVGAWVEEPAPEDDPELNGEEYQPELL
jgi:hypothetical protein